MSRKRTRDGGSVEDQLTSRDGEENDHHHSTHGSDTDPEMDDPKSPDTVGGFTLSEEGEAFFEAIFNSRMEYASRKAKVAKYGQPDSRWAKCPQLDPVVEGILSTEALKQDRVAYRSQEMWLQAMGPLAAALEKASEGTLTLPEVVPMIQSSLMLMADASQHQSSIRRQTLLQHCNPQLKKLMKDRDFKDSQPYLFGEDFGQKAKEKLESAAALRKIVYQQTPKGKAVFQRGHPRKHFRGHGGGRQNNSGPGKYQKKTGSQPAPADKK